MQKKNCLLGSLNGNKARRHAEFISASHLIYNSQSGEILNQVQDDIVFYNGVKAFTLIELLVVVLIIGILAAVAVPQYQKAVEKARATQALTLLKSIGQAVATYRLAAGEAPTHLDDLDIDMSGWTGNTKWNNYALDTKSNAEWSLQLYKDNTGAVQLYMGRISGKYKGAGFIHAVLDSDGQYNGKISCAERKTNGILFELDTGDYCRKIFQGIQQATDSTSTINIFSMP